MGALLPAVEGGLSIAHTRKRRAWVSLTCALSRTFQGLQGERGDSRLRGARDTRLQQGGVRSATLTQALWVSGHHAALNGSSGWPSGPVPTLGSCTVPACEAPMKAADDRCGHISQGSQLLASPGGGPDTEDRKFSSFKLPELLRAPEVTEKRHITEAWDRLWHFIVYSKFSH